MDKNPECSYNENTRLMISTSSDDINAFKLLYQRFAPLLKQFFVLRGLNRHTAEDLVQKVFVNLWQQRKRYRSGYSFEAYLNSIARNTLYKEIRRSRRINKRSLNHEVNAHNILSQPEAELYLKELSEAIDAAKTKLTKEQKQALDAYQDRNIELDKMLKKLDYSKEAYKSHLKRARKQLRKSLASFLTDEKG